MFRKLGQLPLVKDYLTAVQKSNILEVGALAVCIADCRGFSHVLALVKDYLTAVQNPNILEVDALAVSCS